MEIMACWKSAAVTRTLSSELRDDCCGFHQARREGERGEGGGGGGERKTLLVVVKKAFLFYFCKHMLINVISNYYYT